MFDILLNQITNRSEYVILLIPISSAWSVSTKSATFFAHARMATISTSSLTLPKTWKQKGIIVTCSLYKTRYVTFNFNLIYSVLFIQFIHMTKDLEKGEVLFSCFLSTKHGKLPEVFELSNLYVLDKVRCQSIN